MVCGKGWILRIREIGVHKTKLIVLRNRKSCENLNMS